MEIDEFIAADDPAAAARWIGRLLAAAEAAALAPLAGRIVPEHGSPDLREVLVRAYRIVYRVRPEGIRVVTVFEGHRRFALVLGPGEDDDG